MVNLGGMTPTVAEEALKGSVAADKNEILFSRFGINYNNEPEIFRKGGVVFREYALVASARPSEGSGKDNADAETLDEEEGEGATSGEKILSKTQMEKNRKLRQKAKVVVKHLDIIKDEFWDQRPWLKTGKPGKLADEKQNS